MFYLLADNSMIKEQKSVYKSQINSVRWLTGWLGKFGEKSDWKSEEIRVKIQRWNSKFASQENRHFMLLINWKLTRLRVDIERAAVLSRLSDSRWQHTSTLKPCPMPGFKCVVGPLKTPWREMKSKHADTSGQCWATETERKISWKAT